MPGAHGVPGFTPLRVRGGRHRLRRAVRRRRRAMAAGLAVTAAALAASGQRGPGEGDGPRIAAAAQPERRPARSAELVAAPVRIADAETVRLLRPGDRVDVIAAPLGPSARPWGGASEEEPTARVLARAVRVAEVPRADRHGRGDEGGGALVVLSVPRMTAAALAGAGGRSRLAVVVC
ncbi:RcpC/CpaB family pilus assembly protein [Streptomyces sp. NPDC046887]|uniref:RcpC/CpaB family pilus assembly protein n=1 Tax=Streptomyces sp. NPDC046887 TaxID=3155472 RepID=UPI003404A143